MTKANPLSAVKLKKKTAKAVQIKKENVSRLKNKRNYGLIQKLLKSVKAVVKSGDSAKASNLMKQVDQTAQKIKTKGTIHKRTAARIISKTRHHMKSLLAN